MRVVFVGASPLAVHGVKALTERGHEVVLIDQDPEAIDLLSETLDCGLITGDGSRPAILEEVGPKQTDFLFCVTDRDESNMLAALVGRSLGFDRVVPKVEDSDLEPICKELGLDDVIVPDREIATQLLDVVEGRDSPELKTVVRSGLRFFSFAVPSEVSDAEGLELPEGARLIARTRGDQSSLADSRTTFEEGDQAVLIVEEGTLDELKERFTATPKKNTRGDDDRG